MPYYCERCNEYYNESEIEIVEEKEYRGECHGTPAYEYVQYQYCPVCGLEVYESEEGEEDEDI